MPLERTLRHLSDLYQAHADPWGHLSRPYEQDKYARTLLALGDRHFRHGLEIGCGIGALSALLAPRCERLTAIDCVPAARRRARERMQGAPHVTVSAGAAPYDLPAIEPDLIILSEVLYFMTEAEIDGLSAWITIQASPDALVLAVSWQGNTGEALSGDASIERLVCALPDWARHRSDHEGYRIDVLRRGLAC